MSSVYSYVYTCLGNLQGFGLQIVTVYQEKSVVLQTIHLESDNNGRWTIYKIKGKVDTIDGKVATSERKVDTSKSKVVTSRLSKDELEKQIMQVCKDNYIKMEEVAIRIGKSVDYLKNKIFPNMVRGGKLEKRFPYTHNHPEQGYKTTNEYAERL